MFIELDCRKMACPLPVISTKKAIETLTEGVLVVSVDNDVAKENVTKFALSRGCGVSVEQQGQEYRISITKSQTFKATGNEVITSTVMLFTQDKLGHGNEELGAVLMKSFLYTLTQNEQPPKRLIFINSGVKLTVEGSEVLDYLNELSQKHVEIISCGTCLDFYHLKDKLVVGVISNMYNILEELTAAGKVITL